MKNVVVIGLGYVGLPVACLAVERHFNVIGLDSNPQRVDLINQGNDLNDEPVVKRVLKRKLLKATTNYNVVLSADIILVSVPTHVDKNKKPNYRAITNVFKSLLPYLKRGQLIVIESTIGPLLCDKILIPLLETTKLEVGKDLYLAHCPERINPGDLTWNLENIPRVLGANSDKELRIAKDFYTQLLSADIQIVGAIKEAASVKIMENTFRDVNIALVNEFAKSFDHLGIDVVKVIRGASTKPFAFMPHYPSFGIGGYCIPIVPYYLIDEARKAGFVHNLLKTSRTINNTMPEYALNKLELALNNVGLTLAKSKIALLGLSYKKGLGEPRDSAALVVEQLLKQIGAEVQSYDPYLKDLSTAKSTTEALRGVDAVFIATDHKEFAGLQPKRLKQSGVKIILDGKNCLNKKAFLKSGIIYIGIGR